jgi:hypothetical protein
MAGLRRSQRHHATSYDANGREYLASELKCTRANLEDWLSSPTVHPHLQSWHNICISGRRRYNNALQWLDGGEKSYFYNKEDLEEDLLFLCLGEGNVSQLRNGDESVFAARNGDTHQLPTQTLWARTAWRIVQDNRGKYQVFEEAAIFHPAAAYAFAIDVLCISFHSIAYRKFDSVWHELILGGAPSESGSADTMDVEVARDQIDDDSEEAAWQGEGGIDLNTISVVSVKEQKDEDFVLPQTPERSRRVNRITTPSAPRKVARPGPWKAQTHNWLNSLPDSGRDFEVFATEDISEDW